VSGAQVSRHSSVYLNMQSVLERSELVRCLGCHEVYEQAATTSPGDRRTACPHCGELGWLDARVPVEDAEPTVLA
jgi:uncharacterized Zn-finger protein